MDDPTAKILGHSDAVADLRNYIPKVARRDAPVLITGETGTGKERVAAAIHALSPRRHAAFVPVNCAALPESLIESELFGHERGAFTGAMTAHKGKALVADGGTLFLDEIGEMSTYSQAKLLRFLESGSIDRVGAEKAVTSDVRVVAATNENLEDLMARRQFRPDLYYRLNVARIEITPLRARTEDIVVLIDSFIDEYNRQYDLHVGSPEPALLESLAQYDWPGNVRELRNMVEAVFIDPPDGALRWRHVPSVFRRLMRDHRHSVPDEREQLIGALRKTNWNKTEAAKALKLSRMTLYRKMAKYHLDDTSTKPRK